MRLPTIASCEVTNCFYNTQKACHAPAINVGDRHPACDTFIPDATRHIGNKEIGMVGACHVSNCQFNSDLTCAAPNIVVTLHSDHADCGTFVQR